MIRPTKDTAYSTSQIIESLAVAIIVLVIAGVAAVDFAHHFKASVDNAVAALDGKPQ